MGSPMRPRPAFYHNVYADQLIHPSAVQSIESQDSPSNGGSNVGTIYPIQGRVPARFLMGNYGNLNHLYTTTTLYSTVTTVVIRSCIPSGYFKANAPACASRKKREILADESISPSQVEQMVTSVEPKLVQKRQNDDQPDIVSSLEKMQDPSSNSFREKRLLNFGLRTVTTTSIVFQATTIRKSLFTAPAVDAAATVLPCIPSDLPKCTA